ncbi:SDR family NAD(P)-dependent oxidoreductase [Breznakia pachnodae]|uniref:UDP-glucuronate 4-epimerase n=1 Tax=Breznakia pachnodae TaxID=265178 RepID=A0ABU0DZ97_9FIRM|nr:SDR family NAD(P)-dependent oxidoreductase [Breznakia pachnodae]MDQ0359813.1 UDP-glucuronate 4-epimerase [Breznakia pachnodae]
MYKNIGKMILVTGAAGFVGSHLSEKLLSMGHDVISIDNFNDYYDPKLKEKNLKSIEKVALDNNVIFKMYKGDIRDSDLIDKVFKENAQISSIVSLAANAGVRPSIENPNYYVDVNLVGLTNLLEIAKNCKIKNFVFISSSSVYGNNKKVPFSEKDSVDEPISPYAATKKAGELLCYTYHHLFKMNIACLRYFTVYGPRQRPDLAINKFTKLMIDKKPIPMYGDGSTARDYTFVSDIVEGTLLALDYVSQKNKEIFDIFNLGGSNPITLLDLINEIGEKLNIKPLINQLPMQPGDVNITYSDYSHAKKTLGYNPKVKIDAGIAKFVKWYIEENM